MKQLKQINLSDITDLGRYIVNVTDDENDPILILYAGEELVKYLRKKFDPTGEWKDLSIEDFLDWANDVNGDGYPYVQVYEDKAITLLTSYLKEIETDLDSETMMFLDDVAGGIDDEEMFDPNDPDDVDPAGGKGLHSHE